jgi:hypothetical protein
MNAALLLSVLALVASPTDPLAESETVHELPQLGLKVIEQRWVDPVTGVVLRSARDQNGRAVLDLEALVQRERMLARERFGKLSNDLIARLAQAQPEEPIDVVFWLAEPAGLDLAGLMRDEVAAGRSVADARQLALATARAVHEPANQAFAQRLLAAGFSVTLVGDYWPDVFATLPASAVRAWAAEPEIDLAYRHFKDGGPELDWAQGTMRTHVVHDLGITGATGPTKVFVNDCGEVTSTHSWLPPVIHGTANSVQSHPCGVAGNICANNGSNLFGAAKGLPQLYSYDGCGDDALAQTAWSWGMGQGIDLGNCSWWNGSMGSIVFLDRFFDYTIRNFSVMLFKSNGNQGGTGTPYATTPGNGYNMISSGCYNDGNNWNWTGDAMASYSSWWNPVEGHEKPEVATPGDIVTTTGTSGTSTQSFNGTSSASPLTCGVATLLCNEEPSILASMTTLKAALMVGAWHNVEGAQPLSDVDGAGGVHAAASDSLLRNSQYEAGVFTAASFPSGVYNRSVPLIAGLETRIIALWFSDPDAAYSTDLLKMDLDLTVLDPSNAVVASSANTKNPFELVQFTPAVTGTYTVRLTRQKFLGTSEPYTIAWSTKLDAGVGQIKALNTATIGGNLQLEFTDRYDPNVGYTALASWSTLPSYYPLSNGWVLPIAFDRLARLAQSTLSTGFTGTLSSAGKASATLHLPNLSNLIGQTFYVSFYTYPVGNPGSARGVAQALPILIH